MADKTKQEQQSCPYDKDLYDRNQMFIRMQFSREISGVNANSLDRLLFDIYQCEGFRNYKCSLGVGFSELPKTELEPSQSSEHVDSPPNGGVETVGLFYCKSAPVFQEKGVQPFTKFQNETRPAVMIEIFSNEVLETGPRNQIACSLLRLIKKNLHIQEDTQPQPQFCFMNFIAQP